MAEFSQSYGCSKPLSDMMDPSLELLSHLAELSGSVMGNAAGSGAVGYSNESYLPEFSMPFHDGLFSLLNLESPIPMTVPELKPVISAGEQKQGDKKRKAAEAPDSGSQNGSEAFSVAGLPDVKARKKNSAGPGKKKRSIPKEEEKPKEVVHVRARRGQATDSHSLAERVRRGKINERMRCLQDLVPGCYKMMGMAGMLDEIINYVQSLQNQVEFLSMKLSAASSFYDYNLDMETVAAAAPPPPPPQQVGSSTGAYYIEERRNMVVEEVAAAQQQASSTPQCPFDPTFGPWLSPCL